MESMNGKDSAEIARLKLEVIDATDKLDAYIRSMCSIYQSSLLGMEGEVTEAQGLYQNIVRQHVKRMEENLGAPWLSQLEDKSSAPQQNTEGDQ